MSSSLLPRLLPRSARSSTSTLASRSARSISKRRLHTSPSASTSQQASSSSSPDPTASTSDLPPLPAARDTFERSAPPHTSAIDAMAPPPKARMVPLDMQDFLRGYPTFVKNRWHQLNASFYANEQLASPSDWSIEDLLFRLRKDPSHFKDNHAAFEWLFPVPEASSNLDCWKLQPHEIQAISASPLQLNRLIRAYDAALRVYGITLIDRATGLLRAGPEFAQASPLLLQPPHPYRLSRILKSLTLLSPSPLSTSTTPTLTSHLSLLHHVASLPMFLLAHHNDATPGFPSLSPNTPGGDALELRWGMCFREKPFRLSVNELVRNRRGTAGWVQGGKGKGNRWGVREYEEWCVSRDGSGTSVKDAVKRGRDQRKVETEWLSSDETKAVFLTPSSSRMVRKVSDAEGEKGGGIYDAEAYQREGEGLEGEWEEVLEFKAEQDGLRDVEGERDAREEERERVELEGFVGREMERGDEEDEEGGYTILPTAEEDRR